MNNFEYIVVQAGGKGTRMKHLTNNKPKALVPIDNLPLIFHLFKKYPMKKFIVIGDYKCDVLRKYLQTFATVKHIVVDAMGKTGTCGGIRQAMDILPENAPFMLIWSDLVLPEDFHIPEISSGLNSSPNSGLNSSPNPELAGNAIGISKGFTCRWSYRDGKFEEVPSDDYGVAGLFVFQNKSAIRDVPSEGEFVRWLQSQNKIFEPIPLHKTKEYGLLEEYEKQEVSRCRPFNRITVTSDGRLLKEGIDAQGQALAKREKAWYQLAQEYGITSIPQIFSYEPFIMEKIQGKNIFEYDFTKEEQSSILKKLIDTLSSVHRTKTVPCDHFSVQEAYVTKTFDRLDKIRDLLPFSHEKFITINGRKCHNIFFFKEALHEAFVDYNPGEFRFIHGDCTFSNMMLRGGAEPVLIDPRGYFGFTENFGDTIYDWAKLYYSIVGNYDKFNLKRFTLAINEKDVDLKIVSNGWEQMEGEFFRLLDMLDILEGKVNRRDIELIHGVIWLSLTTYAWEDYDSVCAAFYNGLYYLEDVLWGV